MEKKQKQNKGIIFVFCFVVASHINEFQSFILSKLKNRVRDFLVRISTGLRVIGRLRADRGTNVRRFDRVPPTCTARRLISRKSMMINTRLRRFLVVTTGSRILLPRSVFRDRFRSDANVPILSTRCSSTVVFGMEKKPPNALAFVPVDSVFGHYPMPITSFDRVRRVSVVFGGHSVLPRTGI